MVGELYFALHTHALMYSPIEHAQYFQPLPPCLLEEEESLPRLLLVVVGGVAPTSAVVGVVGSTQDSVSRGISVRLLIGVSFMPGRMLNLSTRSDCDIYKEWRL